MTLTASARATTGDGRLSPCGLSVSETAGLRGDAATDVRAIADYQKTIYELFAARRFEQLDCLANDLRRTKETFPGGRWKVHTIYLALEQPMLHPTEKDWSTHIRALESWAARYPESITARVALAESYVNYGWAARGSGYTDTVSRSGWSLFEKRAALALKTLEQASRLPTKCPEWYAGMQEVALAQGWSPTRKRALYEKAIQFEPGYYYYYRIYANSLLPQWDGAPGVVEDYLQKVADAVGGSAGDILYFHVADSLLCCQSEPLKLAWPGIERGFDALEKESGKSVLNWNIMARMATRVNDVVVANRMLGRTGDQWSDEVWGTHGYFESVKQWAKQVTPYSDAKSPAEKLAEENLQTPEGQHYDSIVGGTIRSLVPECEKASVNGHSGDFKLLLKIGEDGLVNQAITVGWNTVGSCVSAKAGARNHAYPKPPHADYWVRFEISGEEARTR